MNRDQLLNLTLTDMSFRDWLALFRRRRGIFLTTLLVVIGLAALLSAVMPPAHRSVSRIVMEGRTQASPQQGGDDIVAIITSTAGRDYDVLTQIQILESFAMLQKALNRASFPIPNPLTYDEFMKLPKVEVTQIMTTNVVQLAVEYKEAETALRVAQFLPVVYQEYVLDRQREQIKRTLEFVQARLSEERESMRLAQQEFANYRSEQNVLDSKTESDVRAGQAAEADRKVNEAKADLMATEAALRVAESNLAKVPKTVENQVETNNFDTVEREQNLLRDLEGQRESLLVSNLPDSDRVRRIDALIVSQKNKLAALDRSVDRNVKARNPQLDIYENSRNSALAALDAARAKVAELERVAADRTAKLRELPAIAAKQVEMENRMDEIKLTTARLIALENDIRLRDNALQSPITDITGASPPEKVRPNWPVNMILGTVLGTLLGVLAALVRDTTQDKVNSANEACAIAAKEVLGRVPLRSSARDPLIADPQRAKAFEAYRMLRSSMLLAASETGAKSFVVTSTVPKEGKTVVAGNLAVALALEGKKTLLVDGNLRNPAVHKLFKVPVEKGLGDVLTGKLSADDALKTTETPNLFLLTAGEETENPTELVAADSFKELVESLKTKFDFILFDSAPAYGYADTQSLVSAVKDVIYVTESMAPTKPQLREATSMIEFAGGSILGLVMNKDNVAVNRLR